MVATLERTALPRAPAKRRREANLRIPGPTTLPPAVRRAVAEQMINHRGPEFAALLGEITEGTQRVFNTKNDVLFFPASGTGGLEAAIVNSFSPGDRVLSITIGSFGERWCEIARAFGLDVDHMQLEWGSAADPVEVERRLSAHGPFKGVLVTHNETSTGVTNPVAQLTGIVRRHEALFLVDAVSSMGAIPFQTDGWDVDIAITGSQKAWMCPPGMAMLSVSSRAWEAHARARLPRSYFDFGAARDYQQRGQTPYTPAVGIMYGLRAALRLMEKEGLTQVFRRHHLVAERARKAVRALGLDLAADRNHFSDTVTSVKASAGVDLKLAFKRLRDEHDVVLATGQEHWRDTHFRIGHLGHVRRADIDHALDALGQVLTSLRS
ncbi:MAG: pyridoxal-phosphate-dependent aminotransferase family protein [Chloroflexota bacterium]